MLFFSSSFFFLIKKRWKWHIYFVWYGFNHFAIHIIIKTTQWPTPERGPLIVQCALSCLCNQETWKFISEFTLKKTLQLFINHYVLPWSGFVRIIRVSTQERNSKVAQFVRKFLLTFLPWTNILNFTKWEAYEMCNQVRRCPFEYSKISIFAQSVQNSITGEFLVIAQ